MSQRQHLTVRRYADLLERAREFITQHSRAGEMLVLGTTREAADAVVRSACGPALIGVHRLAWREFVSAASALRMSELGLTPVARPVREALTARSISVAGQRGLLSYIQPVSRCPGTPRALSATFEDLRLNRVTSAALRARTEAGLRDLAELLDLYEAELADGHFADHAARVELCIEATLTGANRFSRIPLVVLDVQPRGVAEQALLSTLVEHTPAALVGKAGETHVEVTRGLESIQAYLFSKQKYPARDPDGSFKLFAASGEAIECVEIARRIQELARNGTRFDQIAILLRDPARYQPLVNEALRRAGIPAHFTSAGRRPDAAGRAFLAILRCAEDGLSATAFAEYLSLGQAPCEDDNRSQPYRWEQLLADAAVMGGRSRWERRLRGVVDELRLQMDASSDGREIDVLWGQIEQYERLSNFALPILARLDDLPVQANWGWWLQGLRDLARETLQSPEDVYDLLDNLAPLAELGPVDLSDVLLTLEGEAANRYPPAKDSAYGKVWVGSIAEARGFSFAAVFLPGVNESVFPKPVHEDPFLLDESRKQLGMQLLADDTELLQIAVACASEQLTMSYSRMDVVNGRQRVPSFFAFEAFKAARGSDVDIGQFRDAVEEASGSRLGWPAPDDPAVAIDDAEFDLAVLRAAFDSGGDGEGAYLISANAHAARSLKARFRRWNGRHWSTDDGLIAGTIHEEDLFQQYRPMQLASSPSALQQFAICPYRYALRSIVRLQPIRRPAPLQRMDPITRGQIFHAAQARLLRSLQGAALLPITKDNVEAALSRLGDVVASLMDELAEQLAPAIPQIWTAEWESIHADLRGWLKFKAEYDSEWTPEYFEWGFGLKAAAGRDPHSVDDPLQVFGGYCVQGAIDLIERNKNGELRVVDHKTGKPPKDPVQTIGRGEKLQPALYGMAVAQHFQQPVRGGRLFYCTLRGNYKYFDVPLSDLTEQAVEDFYSTLDDYVRKGFLPAAPREGACARCDFQPVCGPWEEERTQKKPQTELRKLNEVRDLQ